MNRQSFSGDQVPWSLTSATASFFSPLYVHRSTHVVYQVVSQSITKHSEAKIVALGDRWCVSKLMLYICKSNIWPKKESQLFFQQQQTSPSDQTIQEPLLSGLSMY